MKSQVTGLIPQIKPPVLQYRMTGRQLAARLKRSTASQKAIYDHDLRSGALVVVGYTAGLSRRVTGTPRGYQSTASRLHPHERMRLLAGSGSISQYHNAKPSVAAVERYCRKVGLDLIWQAVERLTTPSVVAAG
jgi:hypothetical protein